MKVKQKTVTLTDQRKHHSNRMSAAFLKAVGAVCITIGAAGVFFALGGTPVFLIPVFTAVVASAVIFGVDLINKGPSYGMLLCLMGAALVFFLSVSQVIRGLYGWADYFRSVWNQRFGTFYEELAVQGYTKSDMLLTQIVLLLLASVFICGLVRKERLIQLTVAVYVSLCLSFVLSVEIPVWAAVVLMAGWITEWCCISGPSRIKWEILVFIAGAFILLKVFPPAGLGPIWGKASAGFRAGVRQEIEEIRFGEDSLPGGDLRKARTMLSGTEERLELEMETVSPVYLRGFVGAEYKDHKWKLFTAETYGGEFSGMLSWLEQQEFFPGAQYEKYRHISLAENESEENKYGEEITVSVNNIGADRRYIYLPETSLNYTEGVGKWKQDWYMSSAGLFGRKQYQFSYCNAQEGAETQQTDSWLYQDPGDDEEENRFRQAESVYRSFVYEHYLELEEEQRDLIDMVFFNGDTWEESDGLYTVTSRIRAVLRILASYEEIPAQIPSDEDFLSWFLREGKEGNAAYYATAAVLAYRAAGIPARYVEGYVLTDDEEEETKGNTVTLTDKNAHAWVEVYIDGMGWRTIEVTPGFYEEPRQAEVVIAVPNEALEGSNGETAGIPPSEKYQLPEENEEKAEGSEHISMSVRIVLFVAVIFFALLAVVRHIWILSREYRYRRLTGEEKMYFLYRQMTYMMQKMYQNFNPEQPLELPEQEEYEFDLALYTRTVKRMERIIYGQTRPEKREIPAAEELNRQIRLSLRKKGKGKQRAALLFLADYHS